LYLRGSDVESLLEMEKLLPRAVEVLASAKVDIIVYCCTASGAILGNEEEIHKCDHFSRETNIPMATTMIGVVDALPDEKTRNQVLAENPQKLFGF
jgi:maleate cis-trans isomerase